MMLETKAMKTSFDQIRGQLSIGCVDSEQTAPHDALRRTTFVNVDMGSLGTYHSFM